MRRNFKKLIFVVSGAFACVFDVRADVVIATDTTGIYPVAIAIDSVTNKIYVANWSSNNITIIDGLTSLTSTVNAGSNPYAIAVNPVTNKIYIANNGSSNVTVIDGVTHLTTTVSTGSGSGSIAVNPITNKIYVSNENSNNLTVIDGATDSTTTVITGKAPVDVAVNPVTNKIYVANFQGNSITVIDGATDSTITVATGVGPGAGPNGVAVNSETNKIYVANGGDSVVTVIDGATDSTTTVATGSGPNGLAVNLITNKIYATNHGTNNVTVIDGAKNTTTTISTGTTPNAIAVNQVTNKLYVVNNGSKNVTVIDGATDTTSIMATVSGSFSVAMNLAVNAVTNKVYIANYSSNNVTVIAGPPLSPSLLTPLNGSANQSTSLSLSWSTVGSAISYGLQISTVSTFSNTSYNGSGLSAKSQSVNNLIINTNYYWHANASNAGGTSSWSSIWSFVTFSIPSAGLMAYYPLDSNANDYSGNGNNGTLNGATPTTDRFGRPNHAYRTDTTSIRANNFTVPGPQAISVSAWIRPDSGFNNFSDPNGYGIVEHAYGPFEFFIGPDKKVHLYLFATGHQGGYDDTVSYNFTQGMWYHLAFVAQVNTQTKIFINGIKYSNGPNAPATFENATNTMCMGGGLAGAWLSGAVDDIRIYSGALSDSEVLALYHEEGWTGTEIANNHTTLRLLSNMLSIKLINGKVIFGLRPDIIENSEIKISTLAGKTVALLPGQRVTVWNYRDYKSIMFSREVYIAQVYSGKRFETSVSFIVNK